MRARVAAFGLRGCLLDVAKNGNTIVGVDGSGGSSWVVIFSWLLLFLGQLSLVLMRLSVDVVSVNVVLLVVAS